LSTPERGHPVPVLILAICAISTSAVIVRLVPELHPVSLALWRVAIVGALLAPTLAIERPRLSRRDLAFIAGAGALLALHFWTWFASLHHTTVMRSTVLVCLTPVWAGLLEWTFLKCPPPPRFWPGIIVALCGVILMSGLIDGSGGASLLGDGLALLGGVLSASYLVVGRAVRPRVSIGPYGALICLACAGWLLLIAAATGAPLAGFSPRAWAGIAALALGPQLLGHIGLNYAVRYVSAALVSALILFEPVGATVLGAVVLGELPVPRELAGGLLILAGLAGITVMPQTRVSGNTSTSTPGEK
jgi:drug/metabolite transporter (DMT)-like permease